MINKIFNLKKNLDKKINFFLLYGQNTGLIEDTINNVLLPVFSKNIFSYDESEVFVNIGSFKEKIYNKSLFEKEKLIIINKVSDKILEIIEEIIEIKTNDIKIILKSEILAKKSKLRNFFENNKQTIIIPCYEDDFQTLLKIANETLTKNKIKISPENLNFIVMRAMGNRIELKNELNKIVNFHVGKKSINQYDLFKLTNLAQNFNASELIDNLIVKNKKKMIDMLNENDHSKEDSILILKALLIKLKKLKILKFTINQNKQNIDLILAQFKPPIFWKEKDILKKQLTYLSLKKINYLMKEVNYIETQIKKNFSVSKMLVENFLIEKISI